MESRLANRRKDFKKTSVDPIRQREDQQAQIRKADRDAQAAKRRQVIAAALGEEEHQAVPPTATQSPRDVEAMRQGVLSQDPVAQFENAQKFRRLLSVEKQPPIDEVINAGVIPAFVGFLRQTSNYKLQFEAAWVLTNVASGSHYQTNVVIEQGAVPLFVELLSSPTPEIREQAVWGLGNIAGDTIACRDMVLKCGAMQPLLKMLHDTESTAILRNVVWTLSNLCRGKPEVPFELVSPCLPALKKVLYTSDVDLLTDACWTLSYLCDRQNHHIQVVLDAGVAERLVALLLHPSPRVQTPALRAVGNIVTGNDQQTQTVIYYGALYHLLTLLASPKNNIRKETCWAISNITAGNREQIEEVIRAGLINPLIHLLQVGDFDIRREAAWAVCNACTAGNVDQVERLVGFGCIKPMVDLLGMNDVKAVTVALESLENVLRTGRQKQMDCGLKENPYVELLDQADGFDRLESLQATAGNQAVYNAVVRIVTTYLPVDSLDDVEDSPAINAGIRTAIPAGGFDFEF